MFVQGPHLVYEVQVRGRFTPHALTAPRSLEATIILRLRLVRTGLTLA
jgi:hypothetical protein